MTQPIDLPTFLMQYGLAGIVVYIFYRLSSNDLKDLKTSIDRLSEKIDRLIEKMK